MAHGKLIALCGLPGAGKSEVQRILHASFGVVPVDDGFPMRDFAMRHLGAMHDDVFTPAGKERLMRFDPERRNRQFLGDFGVWLETYFGDNVIPEMALRRMEPGKSYSIGVRRMQGRYLKSHGALVADVQRPGLEQVHSFDSYDRTPCTLTIPNIGTIEDLRARVEYIFGPWLTGHTPNI